MLPDVVRLWVESYPELFLAPEPIQLGLRQRVCQAKGDKIDYALLPPMRELSVMDGQRCIRIEKWHYLKNIKIISCAIK